MQRLITAALLIPLVVWGIFSASSPVFATILGAVMLIGAWEWRAFAGLTGKPAGFVCVSSLLVLMLMVWWLNPWQSGELLMILIPGLMWWLLALHWVWRYPQASWGGSRTLRLLAGLLTLLPAWLALTVLHDHENLGPKYVLFMMVLIWSADSGAYFAGRRWGRRKLAPHVSPGKTIEGLWGALAVSSVWAGVGLWWLTPQLPILFLELCLVTVLFSVLGDLSESMFKRFAGIKDSGQILPGHGGVLDRIDSLTAAAPVFTAGLLLMDAIK